ncbi:monofunctional biosynthetic peptidoglycan transglycosylase [Solimonas aquatica]|uniref:Biosynthetic peptidoglycan transglycosylase n=1 Tax=Solimonas aquatica TaxID=489703 RepID=A0A1H9BTJ6_9GAMM|nr:monofunctional biosynthetic peptidoglycan transglycosylase [Solimonas aquatica]SEP91863.1 monofunctional biosynthetic peptidoglycan transglycosylase [Solimonas aquatica]
MLRLLFWLLIVVLSLTLLPVALLRFLPPPTTAYMLQSPVKPVRYEWVPASRISAPMRRAVVISEDQKFWDHHGFDVEAMQKAYEHNQRSKRKRGASTISQQTAKNLFLWPGGGYLRKGIEAGYTVLLEQLWSKDRILEMYLNIAEFGPGIYGVEAAAQAYFHESAAQLSASEAARLAAILPSPRRWNPVRPGPYVQSRANWIAAQLRGGRSDTDEPEMPEFLRRALEAEEAGRSEPPPEPSHTPAPPDTQSPDGGEAEAAPPVAQSGAG